MKKLLLVLLLAVFMGSSAWAGNTPEFDAVGDDSANFFAANNLPFTWVTDWMEDNYLDMERRSDFVAEYFETDAGQPYLFGDPCYGPDFESVLTVPERKAYYEWKIVLQMVPETDINLNIYDCVMKHNQFDIWKQAEQTGRYRTSDAELRFVPTANPRVTVKAYPGPYATSSWTWSGGYPQYLDARKVPGLWKRTLDDQLYTSKAFWDEAIIIALPHTGRCCHRGDREYNLQQGDMIKVKVEIPMSNMVDIFYGEDSVILKYVGVYGTSYFSD